LNQKGLQSPFILQIPSPYFWNYLRIDFFKFFETKNPLQIALKREFMSPLPGSNQRPTDYPARAGLPAVGRTRPAYAKKITTKKGATFL
jgi:hypothetical protein